jgi:DNA-binding CsgD family transcriptional regulator
MVRTMPIATLGAHPRFVGFYGLAMTARVARRCRDHVGDERSLRTALVEDVRRSVPFEWHVWALSDPETEVAISPLATVPEHVEAQLPGLVRRRYLTQVNRWDLLTVPVEGLFRATAGDPAASLLYREILGPSGVGDIASAVFRDRFGCWGFLDLWRPAGGRPFTDVELELVAEDVPIITEALRRCQARSFDEPSIATDQTGPAVLFLSPELVVLGQTPGTDAYLRALLPTDADRHPIPAGAYNVAAALLAGEAGVFGHQPVARVRPVVGTWLTYRAARIDSGRQHAERDIAVTIELTSPGDRRSLYARSHGLSPRETELIELVAEGADTRSIAARLFVSEHTVQDHLKSIFAKTGTHSRRTLLVRLAGVA